MKINPIAVLLNNNQQSTPLRPTYRGLTADKFEKSISFEGRYVKPHKSYSTENRYWKNMPVSGEGSIDKLSNFYSRKFMGNILPILKEKLSEIDPNTNEPIIQTIIGREDDLKPLVENLEYLNSRYKSGALDRFSAKEIAYLFSAFNKENSTTMADLMRYLDAKKSDVTNEEYEQILTDVISGEKTHKNDLYKAPKELSEMFASKLEESSSFGKSYKELLAENPEQDAIKRNLDYLRTYRQNKGIVTELGAREFAFYIATDLPKIDMKNPMPIFCRHLNRLAEYLPEGIYNELLDKAITGEKNAANIINLLQQSPSRNSPFNKFSGNDWTDYILKNSKERT